MSSNIDYTIKNVDEIPSPALVVYRNIVERDIQTIGGLLDGVTLSSNDGLPSIARPRPRLSP